MDIKDIRSNEDLDNPKGNNKLKSKDMFYWRDLYKSFGYPQAFIETPIDLWYENPFFGRVDNDGVPVYLGESNLKQVPNPEKTVFALNFVADAYADLKSFMLESAKNGTIVLTKSLYRDLDPKLGWANSHGLYYEWITASYNAFSSIYVNTEKDRKMFNFKGYSDIYLDYVSSVAKSVPLTREGWMMSKFCTPLISGLILEIIDVPVHDKDLVKSKYIQDPNFYFFSSAAKRYGFKIDKNAPWRLVADIDSPEMQKYMAAYDYTRENLFDKAYLRTYEFELEVFKYYVWSWYNEYSIFSPLVEKKVRDSCTGKLSMELVPREKVDGNSFLKKLPDEYWIRMFAFVRGKEFNKKWTQIEFDKIVKRTVEYTRLKGEKTGMTYLYRELNKGRELDKMFVRDDLTKEESDAIMMKRRIEGSRQGSFIF
jgi:hypothetical protein